MWKLKHMITAAFLFAFTAISISGCSSPKSENIVFENRQSEEQPKTTLTFFGFKYESLNVVAIEDSLHHFMDKNPDISISYDGIKSPEYFDVLKRRLETGNGDDIFMVDHARVLELGEQGRLADLSGLSTLDNFSALAKSQMTASGEIYYLPTSISAFGLYCNMDLLKKHGQTAPENLAELEMVCDYFVSQGITPIVANNDISLKTIVIAKSMLPVYQKEDPVNELKRFNSGQADLAETLRPGFELVEYMLSSGWIDAAEALETAKTKDDLVLFAKGEQPFMLTGAWAAPRLRELTPGFEFQVLPYPVMEDGSVLVVNVDTRVSVSAESPRLEQSLRFVEYLTQSDPMWEFVNSQSSFSPLKENRLAEDEAIQPIGAYLTNGRSVLGSDDNLLFPIWEASRICVVEMLNGGSAEDAVSNMKQQLKEYNLADQR